MPRMSAPRQFGRYRVVRSLGAGAMGQVHEGFDPQIERRVAIKTIRLAELSGEMAAEFQARFRSEMRAAGRLQHPHIVALHDAGQDDGIAYIVMEFVEGEDLKRHLDRGTRFTTEQSLELVYQLLSALAAAHAQGVVHRDVKPANVMLTPQRRVKLADFGVARLQDGGDATRTRGMVVGTVRYASPEQLTGGEVDGRSDLFSCGALLYRLLTHTLPFDGPNELQVMHKVLHETPAEPTTLNPDLPAGLNAVVMKALEKDPGQRFADATEFATALVPYLGGEPSTFALAAATVPATPPPSAAAAARNGMRSGLLATGALLLLGIGVVLWMRPHPPAAAPGAAAQRSTGPSGFEGDWVGLFACSELLNSADPNQSGRSPFSDRVAMHIDAGKLTWTRKRGNVSETISGTISTSGMWTARGQGGDTVLGSKWLTAGSGYYNRAVNPNRLDGEMIITSLDGSKPYRRCTFGAVRG